MTVEVRHDPDSNTWYVIHAGWRVSEYESRETATNEGERLAKKYKTSVRIQTDEGTICRDYGVWW